LRRHEIPYRHPGQSILSRSKLRSHPLLTGLIRCSAENGLSPASARDMAEKTYPNTQEQICTFWNTYKPCPFGLAFWAGALGWEHYRSHNLMHPECTRMYRTGAWWRTGFAAFFCQTGDKIRLLRPRFL